jgi:hypothetical protein
MDIEDEDSRSELENEKRWSASEHELSGLEGYNKMMDEDVYWDLIERCKSGTKSGEEMSKQVEVTLAGMSAADILSFELRHEKMQFDAYTSKMWCAANIMNRFFCSDDGFADFRAWLISRGKETYYNALKDPDSLVKEFQSPKAYHQLEDFLYVAHEAFEYRTGKGMFDYLSKEFLYEVNHLPKLDLNWQDSMADHKKLCPKLFKAASKGMDLGLT